MHRAGAQVARVARAVVTEAQRGVAFKQLTPGARSTVAGVPVTVFGATGFLGRYVVNYIGKTGSQVIVPYRGDEFSIRHLKLSGDLGQIVPVPFHPNKMETIQYLVERSAIVVNCVGARFETRNFSFEDVHVRIPQMIARASKEAGVKRFIHISALSADPSAPSKWSRTKSRGEDVVLEEYPDATVLRPGPLFGHEDKLLLNNALFAKLSSLMPIIHGDARVQPTYVLDVAQAVLNAVRNPDTAAQVYDLAGPNVYTREQLLRTMLDVAGLWRARAFRMPAWLAAMPAVVLERIPMVDPIITRDQIRLMSEDAVLREESNHKTFADLGIAPQTLEKHLVALLKRFRPPRATIGFELTRGVEEAKTWPDDLVEREMALGPFKRLNIREELRRLQ